MTRYLLLASLFIVSCSDNDGPDLVRRYEVTWESHIGSSLYDPSLSFDDNYFYGGLVPTGDGYIIVGSRTGGQIILVKTDLNGNKIKEKKYENFTYQDIFTANNHIYLVHATTWTNFKITKVDFQLNEASVVHFDTEMTTFARFYFDGDFIYIHGGENSTLRKINIFNGQEQWIKTMTELGLPGFINPTIFKRKNESEITLVYYRESFITISHLDAKTGNPKWTKDFTADEDLPMQIQFGTIVWGNNNKLYIGGISREDQTGAYLAVIRNDGSLERFSEVLADVGADYRFGAVMPTKDKGMLFTLDVSQHDPVNFRLLKTDAKLNPGWVGSFSQLVKQYLSGITELENGNVVVLTSQGFMFEMQAVY